jgi:hypothetical protein
MHKKISVVFRILLLTVPAQVHCAVGALLCIELVAVPVTIPLPSTSRSTSPSGRQKSPRYSLSKLGRNCRIFVEARQIFREARPTFA